ncbi:MAG: hypothetical protein ACP5VS_16265, partial [Desulfomonilaceae bacterium]
MRKVWLGILGTLLLAMFVAPAFAWEFKMEGQYEWRYRYFGRANGYQDLFGDMRYQDNPFLFTTANGVGPIGFAGQNLWRGFNGSPLIPMQTGDSGGNNGSGFTGQLRIVRGGNSYADC